MEKIPAACATEWSIQLHKNLRSKEPGKTIEALKEIGSHLERWNKESRPTVFAEHRLFGLIPGEEKLFLNSIFLRLADAFRFGNKQTKNEVVKLFLRIRRSRKRDGGGEGILSKDRLENYMELLRRVKEVFDNGDAEEKVSALLLFGCWANIAKDCADIRYIVLSSLVSSDVLEVKASLFAAGCLCELSDDFGNVFLEILTTILISPKILKDVKLTGARTIGQVWCSFSLADKAYKTGFKLLMDSSEDDFSTIMLISLSRIAFRWKLLIPTQVELLSVFLSEDRSLHLRATSLRCHLFILARGVWNFPSSADMVQKLFDILTTSKFPVIQQLDASKVLHKVFLLYSSTIPCMEIPELFLKLVVVVENMVKSSIVPIRVLAVRILSDLSEKVLGRADIASGGTGTSLACKVISFALDQILFLTPKVEAEQHEFSSELEIQSFLNLLFILVEKHSYLCCIVLKEIHLLIGKLTSKLDNNVDTEETAFTTHEPIKSKLMLYVSKILVACLNNIGEADTEIYQLLEALKLQAEKLSQYSYFGLDTSMPYFLLLHLCAKHIHMIDNFISSSKTSGPLFIDAVLQPDISTIIWVEKILGSNSYWSAYKVGKVAACHGAWSTAAFIFEQLMKVVQSASYFCWLKSLVLFSTSEKQMQSVFLHDQSTSSSAEINFAERQGICWKTKHNYDDILIGTHNMLLSSEELLATSDMGHLFSFQIWFLTIRVKFLRTVVDMVKLLDTISCLSDDPPPSEQLGRFVLFPRGSTSLTLVSSVYTLTEVSYGMKKLAQELDLLILSSIGMDRQSVIIIAALALSCSLLAFIAGFVFLIPKLHSSKKFQIYKSENSEDQFHALLVQDLAGRLRRKDAHTRRDLLYLLKSLRNFKGHSCLRFQTQISVAGFESRVLHKLCEDSITGIVSMQKEANQVQQDADGVDQIIKDGCQLLLNVISKLFLISFRTPNHFFRARPSVSFELFVVDADGKSLDNVSVLSGFHLSLSLCFRLKNLPPSLQGHITKVCCVLNCKLHCQITEIGDSRGKTHLSGQDQEIDDMMGLNEKLHGYAMGPVKSSRDQDDDRFTATECVYFELNEQGQGFASCLLDVSAFPVGSHRIKWLSGFRDGGGSYWCLLPQNPGMFFTVVDATGTGI